MGTLLARFTPRLFAVRSRFVAITLSFLMVIVSMRPVSAYHQEIPQQVSETPHLELSVIPSVALPGTLITLHISYHNIGMPYTDISIDPPNLVTYEPELTMPCKYFEHPNGCTAITLRTLKAGVVTFRAGATGEIYDDGCSCWRMSGGMDNGPANVEITNAIWLPVLYK